MSLVKPSAIAATGDGETILLTSRLLGTLPVRAADLVTFPAGLFGFEASRRYALVAAGRDGLWWLQSAEREELAFLVADPFAFFPGHEIDVPPSDLAHLDATESTALVALVIVTLPAGRGAPTANLRAPILVDPERRLARQIVLADESLSLTAPIAI